MGIVHGIAAIEDPRINVRLRVCLRCEDPLEMGGTAPLEPPHEQTKARIGVCRRCRILYVLTE